MKLFKSLLVAPAALGLLAPISASASEVNLNDISNYSDVESIDFANSFDNDAKKVIENEETKTNTIIGVSIKDNLLGFILLGDLLRDDSIKTVQNLRENKFKISILSGDRKQTVLALAKKLVVKKQK